MAANDLEPMGIPGVRRPGVGTVMLVSALTAAIVAAATVLGLLRLGQPLLTQLAGHAPTQQPEPARAPEMAVVPDLVGSRLEAADELLVGRGLRLVVEARRPAPEARNTIVEQRPLGLSRVEAGAPVAVVVSEGADTVTVPQLAGTTLPEARAALEALGLQLGPVSEAADGTPGRVLSASPEAGALAARDAAVAVTVGPAVTIKVPKLIGLNRHVAQDTIRSLGLEVGKISEIYDRRRRGDLVLEQTPDPSTELPPGGSVSLIVNQGD